MISFLIPISNLFIVASNSLIFFTKTAFYSGVVEDVAQEMTLTG